MESVKINISETTFWEVEFENGQETGCFSIKITGVFDNSNIKTIDIRYVKHGNVVTLMIPSIIGTSGKKDNIYIGDQKSWPESLYTTEKCVFPIVIGIDNEYCIGKLKFSKGKITISKDLSGGGFPSHTVCKCLPTTISYIIH